MTTRRLMPHGFRRGTALFAVACLLAAPCLLAACTLTSSPGDASPTPCGDDTQGCAINLPTATASSQPTAPGQGSRAVTVLSVRGDVTLVDEPGAEPRPAQDGDVVLPGAELTTGADGTAVLGLDDGTAVVLASDSRLSLKTLEGTPPSPVTRFFINIGRVFTFRAGLAPLPEGAAFEVEAPAAVLAIRGSSLAVFVVPPDSQQPGVTTLLCLAGQCEARSTLTSEAVVLAGSQRVEVDTQGDIGPVEAASDADLDEAEQAFDEAQDAGTLNGQSIDQFRGTPTPGPPLDQGPGGFTTGDLALPQLVLTPASTRYQVPASTPFDLHYGGWGATTPEYAEEAARHLTVTLLIDGSESAGGVQMPVGLFEGSGLYGFRYRLALSGLAAGSHTVQVIYTLDSQVTDGLDGDGNGQIDLLGPGEVYRLEFTITAEEPDVSTVFVRPACGDTYRAPAGKPILLHYGSWGALGADLVTQNVDNMTITLTVDGQEITGTRNPVSPTVPCREDEAENAWFIWFTVMLDPLPPGEHSLVVVYDTDTQLTDGGDYDEDGQPDFFGPGEIARITYTLIVEE